MTECSILCVWLTEKVVLILAALPTTVYTAEAYQDSGRNKSLNHAHEVSELDKHNFLHFLEIFKFVL